jgi:hypothetical protein
MPPTHRVFDVCRGKQIRKADLFPECVFNAKLFKTEVPQEPQKESVLGTETTLIGNCGTVTVYCR